MRFGQRQFCPSLLMTVLTFAGLIIFVSLGLWQLDRAVFKMNIQNQFEARLAEKYLAADAEFIRTLDAPYYKVLVEGKYLTDKTMLLDNQLHTGKAGYHVITPFRMKGSQQILLVNRGWLPLGRDRQQLPKIELPKLSGQVKGILSQVAEGFRLGEINLTNSWPQLLPFIDLDVMQQTFDQQLLPFVLWLSPEQPGFYIRDWHPVWYDPEKSRAYAVQWFSFAVILLILFFGLNLRVVK